MTLTTTPNQLTDGLERLLRPLNKLHVPIHEIAMMMSIALRFIPILLEETDKIMKAQIARGADFENGNLVQKAKNMIPLLVPLFISAFRRANDLAMAMEARCYRGGDNRTKMKPLKYEKRDRLTYAFVLAYLVVGIFAGNLAKNTDDNRIFKELNRMINIERVYLVIEDDCLDDIYEHNYNSEYNPDSYIRTLLTWQARNNMHVYFVKKENMARTIYELCKNCLDSKILK